MRVFRNFQKPPRQFAKSHHLPGLWNFAVNILRVLKFNDWLERVILYVKLLCICALCLAWIYIANIHYRSRTNVVPMFPQLSMHAYSTKFRNTKIAAASDECCIGQRTGCCHDKLHNTHYIICNNYCINSKTTTAWWLYTWNSNLWNRCRPMKVTTSNSNVITTNSFRLYSYSNCLQIF